MKASSLFTYNRTVSAWLAPQLARTPLTPNHLTTLSLAAGLFAGFCMAHGTRQGLLAGAFFLHLSFILDNCDGAVARIKSMQSVSGMWYDYLADLAVDFALWTGLAVGADRQGLDGHVYGVAALACAGSALNFWRVVVQRRQPAPAVQKGRGNLVASFTGPLGKDGDPSLLVWFLAFTAGPAALLYLGCAYIFLVWSFSLL